jgi:hypothetical protein
MKSGENIFGKLFFSKKDITSKRMMPIRKGNGTGISRIPARTAELVIDSLQTKLLSIWYRAVHCKQRVPEQLKQFGKFEQSEE